MARLPQINAHKVWFGFFAVWAFVLTGFLGRFVQSPGLKQWYNVSSALADRRQEIAEVEARSAVLTHTAQQLEFNSIAQEREIRKVLGYLGEQELVFEFTPH